MDAYLELEWRWARYVDVPHENCVACSSGTAALHLAFECLQLPQGSQVLCPEFTMIACARAISAAGLRPVFVDCCPDTLLMDLRQAQWAVTPQTQAILSVAVYGRRSEEYLANLYRFKVANKLFVVEDLAEAPVPHHPNKFQADVTCYSFYKNKVVAGEEGGAAAFIMPNRAALARELRSQGFTAAHDFYHTPRGMNYRMSNAHAELVLRSLAYVDVNLAKRRTVAKLYNDECPLRWQMPPRDVPWVYDLRLREADGISANMVVEQLSINGIPARHSFRPMSEQEEYRGHYRHLEAYRASREVMYFPIEPELTQGEVKHRMDALKKLLS